MEFGIHPRTISAYRADGGIWYTRKLEVLVGAIPWRFESSFAHTKCLVLKWCGVEVHGSQGHAGSLPTGRQGVPPKALQVFGSLAQLVERFAYIEDAAGSSPAGST